MILCGLAILFSRWVEDQVAEMLEIAAIQDYQDDPDMQNLFDWMQTSVRIMHRTKKH
jgi:hypothetical protein